MIQELTISFKEQDIKHFLNVPCEDENLPYNLAQAFIEIINKSDANSDIVIEELADEFNRKLIPEE